MVAVSVRPNVVRSVKSTDSKNLTACTISQTKCSNNSFLSNFSIQMCFGLPVCVSTCVCLSNRGTDLRTCSFEIKQNVLQFFENKKKLFKIIGDDINLHLLELISVVY